MSRTRLTAEQRIDRETSEADLQAMVTQLAEYLGWQWVHFRPAKTQAGWRVPVSGPLGAGWPDLLLVRPRDRRIVAVELKTQFGKPTMAQEGVLEVLAAAGLEAFVWRPQDLSSGLVATVLGGTAKDSALRRYDYPTEGLGGT